MELGPPVLNTGAPADGESITETGRPRAGPGRRLSPLSRAIRLTLALEAKTG